MAVVAGFDLPPAAHALADLVNHLSPFHYLYGSGGERPRLSDPVLWRQFGPAWLLGLGGDRRRGARSGLRATCRPELDGAQLGSGTPSWAATSGST